jgi:hypothetical protein
MLFYASVRSSFFAAQATPINNGHKIDLTITSCKVNATKKIRESCLVEAIGSE